MQLGAVVVGLAGLVLIVLAGVLREHTWQEVLAAVALELGAVLVVLAGVTIWIEVRNRDVADRRTGEQIRHNNIENFANDPAMLASIAGSPMGDRIAVNALTARLGNSAMAQAVYDDMSAQVVTASERWHDVTVTATLSPWEAGPASGLGSMFVLTMRCEYRAVVSHPVMRFVCTSDRAEYGASGADESITSAWFVDPTVPVDARSMETFEVLAASVNGTALTAERTEQPTGQSYVVRLPDSACAGGEAVISYTYRVLVQRNAHMLYLDVMRPTHRFTATVNYGPQIRHVVAVEFLGNTRPARIEHTPDSAPARSCTVAFDGWIFPRAGLVVVWALDDEVSPAALE